MTDKPTNNNSSIRDNYQRGNVADFLYVGIRVYKEKNNRWYPIKVLRNTAIIKDEHELIKEQWAVISKKLNLVHV